MLSIEEYRQALTEQRRDYCRGVEFRLLALGIGHVAAAVIAAGFLLFW